jgi:alpha-L-rhamnosidase
VTQITEKTLHYHIDALNVITYGLAWEFESAGNSEGWVAWNQITNLQVNQGNLIAQSTGNDPYMGSPKFSIDSKIFPVIKISMKVSSGSAAQLFFITVSDSDYDESKSLRFSVNGDGKFHTYILDMSTIGSWNGTITQIRIDPIETHSSFEVDFIRIMER